MTAWMILIGDVNPMYVEDPSVPFGRVRDVFGDALISSNLECCLNSPPTRHSLHDEGFFADPAAGGEVPRQARTAAVGIANNVNYRDAAA
jgi:hypothetical protein